MDLPVLAVYGQNWVLFASGHCSRDYLATIHNHCQYPQLQSWTDAAQRRSGFDRPAQPPSKSHGKGDDQILQDSRSL